MKLFCVILVSFLVSACDFPTRGSQISYTSYSDAYEVASYECQTNPRFSNTSYSECLSTMDFKENVIVQNFDSQESSDSIE